MVLVDDDAKAQLWRACESAVGGPSARLGSWYLKLLLLLLDPLQAALLEGSLLLGRYLRHLHPHHLFEEIGLTKDLQLEPDV